MIPLVVLEVGMRYPKRGVRDDFDVTVSILTLM